jgi:serine/threonine-protein kinase
MADVYLARFESGERVALKRLRPELASDTHLFDQLKSEARICGLLTHEHIVGFKGVGIDGDGPYLTFEYVEGLSASALLRGWTARQKTQLPIEAVLSLLADLADGLAYAHAFRGGGANGVVHRDVSPDNVLIALSGSAKLADFGIAKVLGATTVTRTGTVKGKLGYLAPELFDSEAASPASDVFSLGATAFRLLAGVPAFQGANEAQIVRAVLHNDPPPVATLRADVPSPLAAWVDHSLRKNPNERPTLAELIAHLADRADSGRVRLAGCVQELLPTADAAQEDNSSARQTLLARPKRRRKSWPAWLAAVFSAVVLGAAVWKGLPATPPPVTIAEPPLPPKREEPLPAARGLGPVVMEKAAPPEPAPAALPKPKPILRKRQVRRQEAVQQPTTPPSPVPATGTLRIKVRPWGDVFVDGTPHGTAPPLAPLELSAGKHSVIVVNSQSKQQRTFEVNVVAGEETELKVVLDDAPSVH